MRVESTKPKHLKSGELGWLHPIGSESKPVARRKPARPAPTIDAAALMRGYHQDTNELDIRQLAARLGVSWESLRALDCAWAQEHHAFAFPMSDEYGKTIGVRLRNWAGDKWAVTGSHQGIFLPQTPHDPQLVLLPEGPTDTAAALSMGFWAVGRPSCSGGMEAICKLVSRLRIRKAAVLADIDDEQELERGRNPGMVGAEMLCEALPIPSVVLTLPAKDIREFHRSGGIKKMIEDQLRHLTWRYPKKG